MEILLDNRQNIIHIESSIINLMKKAIGLCLIKEKLSQELEISISFVDDVEIQFLNKTYRGKDRVTDVLSFPQYKNIRTVDSPKCLGDIVISLQQAKRQAEEFGHSFKREMVFLTVHSMLHLMGYDHNNEANRKLMRQKEEEIMGEMDILRE